MRDLTFRPIGLCVIILVRSVVLRMPLLF